MFECWIQSIWFPMVFIEVIVLASWLIKPGKLLGISYKSYKLKTEFIIWNELIVTYEIVVHLSRAKGDDALW